MTKKQYETFLPICEDVIEQGGFLFVKKYGIIKEALETAKYHLKRQKENLANNYPTDEICSKRFYCEDAKEVLEFQFKGNKNFTLRDWFIIEISNVACISRQKTKYILNKI